MGEGRAAGKTEQSGQRMAFLDAMRGIAVLAVVLQHCGSLVSGTVADIAHARFGLGTAGVTIFFLCSGYIIPSSLARHRSLGRFWFGRFRRLYPLYWCSIAGAMLLNGLGAHVNPTFTGGLSIRTLIANIGMIQLFVGEPDMLNVYWTLGYELLFYALMSLIYLARLQRGLVPFTLALLLLPSMFGQLLPAVQGIPGNGSLAGLSYSLGTMFLGSVVYCYHTGQVGRRAAGMFALLAPLALLTTVAPWGAAGGGETLAWLNGQVVGWLVGYAAALALFAAHRCRFPRPLLFIGTISYSLYLLHALVVIALPLPGPALLHVPVWLAASLALAAATYRWIERPAMRWGRAQAQTPASAPPAGAIAIEGRLGPGRISVLTAQALSHLRKHSIPVGTVHHAPHHNRCTLESPHPRPGLFRLDQRDRRAHVAARPGHPGVPGRGALHRGGVVGDQHTIITVLVVEAEGAEHVDVALIEKDLAVVRHLALYVSPDRASSGPPLRTRDDPRAQRPGRRCIDRARPAAARAHQPPRVELRDPRRA